MQRKHNLNLESCKQLFSFKPSKKIVEVGQRNRNLNLEYCKKLFSSELTKKIVEAGLKGVTNRSWIGSDTISKFGLDPTQPYKTNM